MHFERTRNELLAYYSDKKAKFERRLESDNLSELLSSWYVKQYITKANMEALKECDKNDYMPEAIKKRVIAKFNRECDKDYNNYLAKIEAIEAVGILDNCSISVEWHKSSVWGYNPTATIRAYTANDFTATTGHASGCGYDKESASIASAFNDNNIIMAVLYNHYNNGGAFPYSVHIFAGMPTIDGGCGVGCNYRLFESLGYKFLKVGSGDLFNCYSIQKVV